MRRDRVAVEGCIEALPQCMAFGGSPADNDPTCPQGPVESSPEALERTR